MVLVFQGCKGLDSKEARGGDEADGRDNRGCVLGVGSSVATSLLPASHPPLCVKRTTLQSTPISSALDKAFC